MTKRKRTFYKTISKKNLRIKKPLKKASLSVAELEAALFQAELDFEQAMCQFFLLGKTLKSIKENGLIDGDKVELGVRRQSLTKEVRSFLRQWGFEMGDKSLRLFVKNIPVHVKVLDDSKIYEHPDFVWYKVTQFQIPNPWREAL